MNEETDEQWWERIKAELGFPPTPDDSLDDEDWDAEFDNLPESQQLPLSPAQIEYVVRLARTHL